MNEKLVRMARQFAIEGELQSISPHKSGHINDTYLSTWQVNGKTVRYIHQRINHKIFTQVPEVMRNIDIITEHLRNKIRQENGNEDQTLQLILSREGQLFVEDSEGNFWRTYDFVENSVSIDVCSGPTQAKEAARAMGRFHNYLLDLDPNLLHESIPHFISSPYRYESLRAAITKDPLGRCAKAQQEVDFALSNSAESNIFADYMKEGAIPIRVIHSDMKLNNVLFSKTSGKSFCVVDLDVCMPGYSLYDFGDMVRNTSIPAAEDETDFTKVFVDNESFRAIAEGYMEKAVKFLNPLEISLMAVAPRVLALTLGVRFLTDYILGDIYFKIRHPEHNLQRVRTQFQIVKSMKENEGAMMKIVKEVEAVYRSK